MSLDLESLGQDLKCFIKKYQDDQQAFSALVSREALMTKQHVASEVSKSEKAIKQHMSYEISRTEDVMTKHFAAVAKVSSSQFSNELRLHKSENKDSAQRERVLMGLKFPGMNERRNHISEAYGSTFQWIFEEDNTVNKEEVNDVDDVLENPEKKWSSFTAWLESDELVYWINGKPGSGKTTLLNYLLSQPETKSSLNLWKPNTIVISHFFLRPGNIMQKNVKGFICSLLYQLLLENASMIDVLLEKDRERGLKDSEADWSVRDLRKAFFQVLGEYDKPICLFIDGIDEIDTQQGVQDLLDILEELKKVPNLKMCVTSRVDQTIYDRLNGCPQLRIHDLTLNDLHTYAVNNLRVPPDHPSEFTEIEVLLIISLLIQKADGVFLWLCLAVSSVNRGLCNEDDYTTLIERINSLPSDLVDLYRDMWARMNDDQGIYRKKAAMYFNLVIAASKIPPRDEHLNTPSSFMWSGMTILEMRMASIPPSDSFFSFKTGPSAKVLLKQCQNTEKSLRICCAGLLEISEKPLGPSYKGKEFAVFHKKEFQPLLPYILGERSLRFLHRTAYDFMTDTAEGREILAFDDTPTELLQLRALKASLAVRQVCMFGGMRWICGGSELGGQGTFCASIEHILNDISHIYDSIDPNEAWKAECYHLIDLCERVYYVAQPFAESWRATSGEFLIRAALFNLGDWVPNKIQERKPRKILSSVILMSASGVTSMHRTPSMLKLNRRLLELGCDPNMQHASLYNANSLSLLETPLCHFLRTHLFFWTAHSSVYLYHLGKLDVYIEEVPLTLDTYVAHGANMNEKVLFAFQVSSEGDVFPRHPLDAWHEFPYEDFILIQMPASFVIQAIKTKLAAWRNLNHRLDDYKRPTGFVNYDELDPDDQDIVDDSVMPVSRVVAALDWDCKDGSYCKITKKDSQYLARAVEKWLGGGLQDVLVMHAIAKRLEKVCKRCKRSKPGEHIDKLFIEEELAMRRNI